ncbi:hypothetical protein Bbelb_151290 [Branchiostoma belcheri]|nr:hypothetical protein Bbelb_151290 [Branchiostoma belcheri]
MAHPCTGNGDYNTSRDPDIPAVWKFVNSARRNSVKPLRYNLLMQRYTEMPYRHKDSRKRQKNVRNSQTTTVWISPRPLRSLPAQTARPLPLASRPTLDTEACKPVGCSEPGDNKCLTFFDLGDQVVLIYQVEDMNKYAQESEPLKSLPILFFILTR